MQDVYFVNYCKLGQRLSDDASEHDSAADVLYIFLAVVNSFRMKKLLYTYTVIIYTHMMRKGTKEAMVMHAPGMTHASMVPASAVSPFPATMAIPVPSTRAFPMGDVVLNQRPALAMTGMPAR